MAKDNNPKDDSYLNNNLEEFMKKHGGFDKYIRNDKKDMGDISNFSNKDMSPYNINKISPKKVNKYIIKRIAPKAEMLSSKELAESFISEQSTTDIVEAMIINTYSHLRKEDYGNARKQLGILKSLDLDIIFEKDKQIIGRIGMAIADLEGKF